MGHKHTKEEILDGALAAALDDGLSKLTFGRLAKRLGINDRTIVYYFPSKDALISDVLVAMGLGVQEMLAEAFTAPASDHITLVRAAWPVLQQPATEKIFALFFEANGLAASGIEPYRSLVTELVAAWIAWTADFIDGSDQHRLAEAEAAIAIVDGLLLVRLLAGKDSAARAAQRLGVS
jgi:AcrR family transcriptional regulator